MASPPISCSRRYTERASVYCSRKREFTIASRKDRLPRSSVYQLGRGKEPIIVVGRNFPLVAFSMDRPLLARPAAEHTRLSCLHAEQSGSLETEISDLGLSVVHRTLLLPWTQRICHQSRPQRDRGIPTACFCRLTSPACCRAIDFSGRLRKYLMRCKFAGQTSLS